MTYYVANIRYFDDDFKSFTLLRYNNKTPYNSKLKGAVEWGSIFTGLSHSFLRKMFHRMDKENSFRKTILTDPNYYIDDRYVGRR